VVVPLDLGSLLQTALIQRTSELIGLARRAGQAVAGFEKAREHLRAAGARLVVQARDGSTAERARFLSGAPPGTEVVAPLTGEELGRVFGREYVVHVAIAPGRLADRLTIEAGRLAGLRTRSERA
jgi:ribosomal protein L7Ae-like RNA K-turn-binding protein